MADQEIDNSIRDLRKQLGLTQEKFAAKLGVTCLTVNRWENGRTKPSPMAQKLIRALPGKPADFQNMDAETL